MRVEFSQVPENIRDEITVAMLKWEDILHCEYLEPLPELVDDYEEYIIVVGSAEGCMKVYNYRHVGDVWTIEKSITPTAIMRQALAAADSVREGAA